MANEYQVAKARLELALAEFKQACNTPRVFEEGVHDLVDTLRPYRLDTGGSGQERTQLKNTYTGHWAAR